MSTHVSTIILQQLGGNRFLAMTGAKDLLAMDTAGKVGLRMRLPANLTKGRATHLEVVLTERDDYTLALFKSATLRRERQDLDVREGVYVDNLRAVFTDMTGLDTHL